MANSPRISNAEWEVMTVLWDAAEGLGLTAIIEQLSENQSRNPKTISTYLSRLAAKEVVSIQKVGRTNIYSANIDRDLCLKSQSRDFLRRVFRGATAPMMVSLIRDADLNDEEIDRLQKMLDQKKEAQR